MKKILPVTVAILCGLLAIVDFFIPNPQIHALGAILTEGVIILAGFALFLGILNILAVHARQVVSTDKGRGASVVLIISLLATLAIGVAFPVSGATPWIFNYLYRPLQSTMTALLAFFAVSAAYRTFRLRNVEALILLVSGLFLLFAQLPFSEAISPYIPALRDWVLSIPVTAAVRGILLGTALGTIATSLRVLLAIDKPYAGE